MARMLEVALPESMRRLTKPHSATATEKKAIALAVKAGRETKGTEVADSPESVARRKASKTD